MSCRQPVLTEHLLYASHRPRFWGHRGKPGKGHLLARLRWSRGARARLRGLGGSPPAAAGLGVPREAAESRLPGLMRAPSRGQGRPPAAAQLGEHETLLCGGGRDSEGQAARAREEGKQSPDRPGLQPAGHLDVGTTASPAWGPAQPGSSSPAPSRASGPGGPFWSARVTHSSGYLGTAVWGQISTCLG